jgi:hypothetical protein
LIDGGISKPEQISKLVNWQSKCRFGYVREEFGAALKQAQKISPLRKYREV